ncbi:MAG TPA: DUF2214 family protein [Gammaproteobacteria bacterium]|jgi:putative membrane protein|nr:DUF2214 family protein [Gammaproteobacteria bacterium]
MHDALLAYLHYLTLLAAFSLLVAELAVLRLPHQPGRWRSLSLLDLGYFLAAIGILATGLSRVFYGLKPALYYWHNPYFHALWVTFLFIGLASIIPTLSFMKWAKAERNQPGYTPPPKALRHVQGHLVLEIALFAIAPIFAVLMARGYGM